MFKNHYQDDVPDELLAADGLYPIFITIQVSIFQLAFLLYEEILDSAKGCIFIFDSWFSPKPWNRVPLSALQSIDLTRRISMCVCDVSRFRLMELKWIQRMNGDIIVWRRPAVVATWMGELRGYQDGKKVPNLHQFCRKGLTHQLSWREMSL